MRTVFHLIAGDEDDQRTALSIAENLSADRSVEMDDIVVVAQAAGIGPLTDGSAHAETVASLLDAGIEFRACANTLENRGLDGSALLEGVETVPTGAGELTRLQDAGYAYIRP